MTADDTEADWTDLSGFQRDAVVSLAILEHSGDHAYDRPHGQAIKDRAEALRDEDINHGQLYPNLDEVIEHGFIEKEPLDKRTNGYRLTEAGEAALEDHRETVRRALDHLAVIGSELAEGSQ